MGAMAEGPEVFGPYVVFEQLGVGGMACVHVAESRSAGGFRKRVALKRMLPHAAADPALVAQFTEEARLDARLHHPNIPQTFGFGEVEGRYFIAMELVAGPTVGQLLRQCQSAVGQLPLPIALHILVDVSEALDYAHSQEVIHRDVAPTNIIVSSSGAAKLIDFGVAKAQTSQLKTQAGIIKGKLGYLPPEYLTSGKLDARADLWSLGVVAHELLTCTRLFDGTNDLQVLQQIRERPIEPPSRRNRSVPRSLDAVVMTALERDPARRWQSASAMRNALRGEIKDLHAHISNRQVLQWVEYAFSQTPENERSGVSELISMLDKVSDEPMITIEPDPDTAPGRPTATIKRRLKQPKLPSAPSRARVRWWFIALLLVVAAAAGAVEYFGVDRIAHEIRARF
jgi:serine/threonine protein kinase